MSASDDVLDPHARAAEKQRARDDDERKLASGEKTREALRQENVGFATVRVRPDFAASHRRRG